jgi:protoheme ferro-lyase
LSAETIASLFSNFGDFYIFKNTKKTVLLQFYHFDKDHVSEKSVKGFIEVIKKDKEKFHIVDIENYHDAPKFVAHNRVE